MSTFRKENDIEKAGIDIEDAITLAGIKSEFTEHQVSILGNSTEGTITFTGLSRKGDTEEPLRNGEVPYVLDIADGVRTFTLSGLALKQITGTPADLDGDDWGLSLSSRPEN